MKKTLAFVLALCMVLSLVPVSVQAAGLKSMGGAQTAPAGITPNAQSGGTAQPMSGSYTLSVTVVAGEAHGTVELEETTAGVQESIIFLVDPEPGYLASINGYHYGVNYAPALYYIGLDLWEVIMPDGDVELEVSFLPIDGENHDVSLTVGKGGIAAIDPTSAMVGESIFIAVQPDNGYTVSCVSGTTAGGDEVEAYWVAELDGIRYYELFMPDDDLEVTVEFERSDPWNVYVELTPGYDQGTVTVSPETAYPGDTVTVTCIPDPGYEVTEINCFFETPLTSIGNGQWTFVMPDYDEYIYVFFGASVYDISLVVEGGIGGTAQLSAAQVHYGDTVTVTCTPAEGYYVAQVTAGDATVTDLGDGVYEFTACGDTQVRVLFLRVGNPFIDVTEGSYYYDPVMWAVENGITTGTTDNTFSPYAVTERCQIVTFLWRAMGKPEPTITENPFTDVSEENYFYKAVLWAVEEGITTGTTETTFSPYDKCERCQVITFLYRAMGGSQVEDTTNPFTDVNESHYFYKAVLWAVENGITTGTTDSTFSPYDLTERCQVVTFLYRAAHLEEAPGTGDNMGGWA